MGVNESLKSSKERRRSHDTKIFKMTPKLSEQFFFSKQGVNKITHIIRSIFHTCLSTGTIMGITKENKITNTA